MQLCRAYADRRGWVVVATYHDAALSSFGVEQRPGYQQLVAAASATPAGFETIVVEDLSRLTRDTGELLRFYHRLRLRDIDIVGVSDGIASGQQGGKVHLTVKGLVNELYLDDLRDKTHRGLAGCATRGFSAGGRSSGTGQSLSRRLGGVRDTQLRPGSRSTRRKRRSSSESSGITPPARACRRSPSP